MLSLLKFPIAAHVACKTITGLCFMNGNFSR